MRFQRLCMTVFVVICLWLLSSGITAAQPQDNIELNAAVLAEFTGDLPDMIKRTVIRVGVELLRPIVDVRNFRSSITGQLFQSGVE